MSPNFSVMRRRKLAPQRRQVGLWLGKSISTEHDTRGHSAALKRLDAEVSINPDAHSTSEIDLTHWGVQMARKGGISKSRVLNCLPLGEFRKYLAQRKAKS